MNILPLPNSEQGSTNQWIASRLIEFGAGKEGNNTLQSGWGDPEPGFVWSEGSFSSIFVEDEQRYRVARFSVWAYVPPDAEKQQALFFFNGLLLGASEIDGKQIVSLALPSFSSETTNKMLFSIYLPDAKSPRSAEGAPDNRKLGIAVATLMLE